MSEYTPTTEDVRDAYSVGAMNWRAREVNFDRWLAARDRENRAIGFEAAVSASRYSYENLDWWINPYRGDNQ